MKMPQTFFQGYICKMFAIVTQDTLPGSKPMVSVSILQCVAGDTPGAMRRDGVPRFYKKRVTNRSTRRRLAGRGGFGCTGVVFWRICYVLPGTRNNKN